MIQRDKIECPVCGGTIEFDMLTECGICDCCFTEMKNGKIVKHEKITVPEFDIGKVVMFSANTNLKLIGRIQSIIWENLNTDNPIYRLEIWSNGLVYIVVDKVFQTSSDKKSAIILNVDRLSSWGIRCSDNKGYFKRPEEIEKEILVKILKDGFTCLIND